MSQRRRKRAPRRTVFDISIKQGTAVITANNPDHAQRQADALERDLSHRWRHKLVRQHTEVSPGLFVLGHEAKVRQGMEVWSCPS